MFDLVIENRLPPIRTSAQVGVSEAGIGFVTHNGLPVLHQGAPIAVRFSFVTVDGSPVLHQGGLVVVRTIPA